MLLQRNPNQINVRGIVFSYQDFGHFGLCATALPSQKGETCNYAHSNSAKLDRLAISYSTPW